jgi:AAHS family 4-hydroxybenzoate transporter-like MFS transporter
MSANLPTVSQAIDQSPLAQRHWTIFGVCILVAMLDGWDTQSIGIVAPRLAGELVLNDTQLGALFSSAQLGATIGALLFGWLADRFGRRPLMAGAASVVAMFTTLTALVHGYADLLGVRFAAGVGLGGAIPCALALASEYAPARIRATVVTVVFAGYPVGAAIGGLVNAWLVASADWRTVFYAGGILPALTVLAILLLVPESLQFLQAHGFTARLAATLERMGLRADPGEPASVQVATPRPGASVFRLFTAGMTMSTPLLLAVYLFSYAQTKVISAWFPTLLHSAGQSLSMGAIALAVINVGSAIAAALSGGLIDRFGAAPTLVPALGASAASLLLFGFFPAGTLAVYGLSVVVGVGCGIGTSGAHALAVRAFPSAVRSSGLGLGLAVGRSGQVVSPLMLGLLLSAGASRASIYLAIAALPAAAALAASLLALSAAHARLGRLAN